MKLDELKEVWEQQQSDKKSDFSSEDYLQNIDQKMSDFEQSIQSRDRFEIIACIVVIGIFGYVLLTSSALLRQVGAGIVIAGAAYVWYRLKRAQNNMLAAQTTDRSVKEHLKFELNKVQEQKKMLKNIAWWYIAPIYIGLVVLTIGSSPNIQFQIIYLAVVTIVGIAVWYYNQHKIKKRFNPLISEIDEAIKSLEKDVE